MDMFDDVQGSVTKFADDGTVWHTGKNIPQLAEKVTTDVKKIQHNCNKWRLKIRLGKTEVTLFQAEEKSDNIVKSNLCKIDGNNLSDFIWDFGKLPFPTHLGKYFIKIGKIRAKIHEIGKIKAIFGLGMTPIYGLKNGQIKSLNLKYNSNPKLLGITLDEELNFQEHVNMTEKKASRALQIIREVKGISQIST